MNLSSNSIPPLSDVGNLVDPLPEDGVLVDSNRPTRAVRHRLLLCSVSVLSLIDDTGTITIAHEPQSNAAGDKLLVTCHISVGRICAIVQ